MHEIIPVQEQNSVKKFFAKKGKATIELSMEKSQNILSDSSDVVQTQVPSAHTQGTILFTFQDGGKLNAEIRWTLKDIVSR